MKLRAFNPNKYGCVSQRTKKRIYGKAKERIYNLRQLTLRELLQYGSSPGLVLKTKPQGTDYQLRQRTVRKATQGKYLPKISKWIKQLKMSLQHLLELKKPLDVSKHFQK